MTAAIVDDLDDAYDMAATLDLPLADVLAMGPVEREVMREVATVEHGLDLTPAVIAAGALW